MKHLAICLLSIAACAQAEIIDRVAITVGSDVITESELREEVRVTALLNGEPVQFSSDVLRQAGERLVDQMLIRRENLSSRFGSVTDAETTGLLTQVVRDRFGGDENALGPALQKYQLSREKLLEHLRWQLTALRFISLRFGTGLQTRPEEIENYFRKELAPKLPANASLDDYREQIEQALIQQRANDLAEEWLAEARRRVVVDFHPGVFQ